MNAPEPQRRQDAAAREIARSVFDRPVVLEAGAGTGKTSALVTRLMEWSLGPGWERAQQAERPDANHAAIAERVLSRAVAITFTERAAIEMSQRFTAGLKQVFDAATQTTVERRAAACIAALHRLRVGTIHGFCHRLLAQHALTAGVHPQFTIDADGRIRERVARELIAERLDALYGAPGDRDALLLADRGYGPAELHDALDQLLEKGVQPEELDAAEAADDAARAAAASWREELIAAIAVLDGALPPPQSVPRLRKPFEIIAGLRALAGSLTDEITAVDLIGQARDFPANHQQELAKWSAGTFTAAALRECYEPHAASIAERLAPVLARLRQLTKLDPQVYTSAVQVLRPLLAEARARLARSGALGFDDLISGAARLVGEHPEVADSIASEIDLLLVDEFQDTDAAQCRLLASLAFGDRPGRPSLFLVGDPKQSIYGWRNADLSAYESFVTHATGGAEPQRLSVNFRSVTPILDEVTRLAAPILQYEPGVQPAFQALLTADRNAGLAGFTAGERRPVEYWIDTSRGEPTAQRRAGEARAIAAEIAVLSRQHGVPLREIAILMRTATHQEQYTAALKELELPFVVEGDRSFYRRRETIDAAALLTAIFDPHDHVPLLAFLRGPLCGVPDAALIPLWQADFPELAARLGFDRTIPGRLDTLLQQIAADLPREIPGIERIDGWQHAASAGLRVLAALRRAFREHSSDRFLELTRALLLLEETEAARYLGRHRLANVEQLLRRWLPELQAEGGAPHAALRALRRAVAESEEEREASLADETLDAVRVLTIHKAKGLTFRQVFVIAIDQRSTPATIGRPVHRVRNGSHTAVALFGQQPFRLVEAEQAAQRIARAELARVLYVAITRPSERLVITGSWASEYGQRSLAELIAGREQAQQLERLAEASDGAYVDADGVRWVDLTRLAAHAADGAGSALIPAGEPALDVAQALASERQLATARELARARAARPLLQPMSQVAPDAALDADHPDHPEPAARDAAPAALDRDDAREAGTRLHLALQLLDPQAASADDAARAAAWQVALERSLAEATTPVRETCQRLADRFRTGPLWSRWWSLAPAIVGRELPLLLARENVEGDAVDGGEPSALWGSVGSIDLLYRAADGQLVIADYKSDPELDPEHYAPQLARYARALQIAWNLPASPRTELWAIDSATIVTVES